MDPYQILGLSKKFTLQELKDKYKSIAIKVHPDKGGTEELFLLVTKCYKTLLQEYNRRVSQKEFHELKADFKKAQTQPVAPPAVSQDRKFNIDKFNKVFSENKLENAYDKGYRDWMSDEPVKDIAKPKEAFTLDTFNTRFDKATNIDTNNKYIIKYREPEPLITSKKIGYTELGEEHVNDFSGENTTKKNLNYMDYKVAHTTSKIVDPNIMKTVKQYRNVEDLEAARSKISYDMEEDVMKAYQKKIKMEKLKEKQRMEALRKQEELINEHYARVNMLMLGRK